MDLHPEEAALSGAEDEEQEHSDQDLQIRRTVTQVYIYISFRFILLPKQSQMVGNFSQFTSFMIENCMCLQVVHCESQENGQEEAKRSKYEDDNELQADEVSMEHQEKMDTSSPGAMETKLPSDSSREANTGDGSQGKFWLNTALFENTCQSALSFHLVFFFFFSVQ